MNDEVEKSTSRDASGYIYILFNPVFRENQFKIGMTARTPAERAREISSATGVPQPFEVLFEARVVDRIRAERLLHEKLGRYRQSSNREFFGLPLNEAVAALTEVATAVGQMPPVKLEPTPASRDRPLSDEFNLRSNVSRRRIRQPRDVSQPLSPVEFDDHLDYADAIRRPLLQQLRQYMLSLDGRMGRGEAITKAQRIAYRIPGGTIFIEIKVQRSAILVRLIETGLVPRGLDVRKIPESHGWRDLKDEIRLTGASEMPAALLAIQAAYRNAATRTS